MSLRVVSLGLACLIATPGCSGDDDPPPPPTQVTIQVVSRTTGERIEGAWVRAGVSGTWTAAPDGTATFELSPGAHPAWASASGFLYRPGAFEAPPEVDAIDGTTTTASVALDVAAQTGRGVLRGVVQDGGAPVAGALVVASGTIDAATVADPEGNFVFTNLPLGTYTVRSIARSKGGAGVSGRADPEGSERLDVALEEVQGLAVSGAVEGEAGATTTLQLLHAASGRPVPGVERSISAGEPYTLEGVPAGTYEVAAALALDDGLVMDPDPLRRGPLTVTVDDASRMGVDFGLVPAVPISAPTGGVRTTATPRFEWAPVAGADFYVLELRDAAGQNVWGGFDATGNWRFRVLAPETARDYEGPALIPGARYRWRVFAAEQDPVVPSGFRLVAGSEVLEGGFSVGS